MKTVAKNLLIVMLAFSGAYVFATPVDLNVTSENNQHIKAVLWGGLAETPFEYTGGARVWQQTHESEFWRLQTRIAERYQLGGLFTTLEVTAQHKTAMHEGEVTPGFALMNVHLNLGGDSRYEFRPVSELSSDAIHPGAVEHHDHLFTFVMDMDERLPGLLSNDGQIYAVIEAAHMMPEPATVMLLAGGAVLMVRRRKQA